jgi:hypothetical protein
MKKQVCTKFDSYMRGMTHNKVVMSWQAVMQDGTSVWGDYERPGFEKCWLRFKEHCETNKIVPVKIQLYMFGMQEYVFFEDPNGLDGFSIMRGCSRDQGMDGSFVDFQFLSVSLLRDSCDYVDVRKFVWPETDLEPLTELREVTQKSIDHMVFKHDSEKTKRPEVQKYLNRAAL